MPWLTKFQSTPKPGKGHFQKFWNMAWSIFDVGDHFYKNKLWKVKFLTFEGEAQLPGLPGFRQISLRNFEPYA